MKKAFDDNKSPKKDGPLLKVSRVVVILSAIRGEVVWEGEDLDAWQAALNDLADEVDTMRKEVPSASV